jgi:hypothetical protein
MDDDEIQDDADFLKFSEVYQVIVVDAKTGLSAQQTVVWDMALSPDDHLNLRLMDDIGKVAQTAAYLVLRAVEDVQRSRELARLWIAEHPDE